MPFQSFNLQQELLTAKTGLHEGHAEILLTFKEIDKKLNKLEDAVGETPVQVLDFFDDLKGIVAAVLRLSSTAQVKLLGLLSNGYKKLVNMIENCLKNNSLTEQIELKTSLELFSYLLYSTALLVENGGASGEEREEKKKGKSLSLDWDHIKLQIAESSKLLFSLTMERLFECRADSELVASCIVKLLHLFLERPEAVKLVALKTNIMEALVLAVKKQNYGQGMKVILVQDLNYFEHLAEYSADFLDLLATTYDDHQLLEDVLKDVCEQQFGSTETAAARVIAQFLEHLSKVAPKISLKMLTYIVTQLDSESHTIRIAVLQVIGNIVKFLTSTAERTDQTASQAKSLLAILEERFRDVNSFVRARVLNILGDLCRSQCIPINRRSRILTLTIDRVMDKSSNVRKKAVQLLGELIKAHPFGVDGGELDLHFFQARLSGIDAALAEMSGDPSQALNTTTTTSSLLTSPRDDTGANQMQHQSNVSEDSNQINSLLMQKKYYNDAVKFVQQLDKVIPVMIQLLSSTVKTEVFEVMDFFVDAHNYKLRSVDEGIKKMMHLVWEKDLSTEDGTKRSIRDHLVDCYQRIYLEADDRLSERDKVLVVCNGLLEYD